MDKKILAFLCIAAGLIIFGTALMALFYNPDNYIFSESYKRQIITPFQPDKTDSQARQIEPAAPVENFIAGTCALFLIGYLFLFFYRKFQSDSNKESIALETNLYKISVETGRTEYELFSIAAEGWTISENQIEADFKNYMGNYTLPYYVVDFVRKNYNHIDHSLRKGEEVADPASLWDLVKALLIFPGCIFLLPLLGIIFGYNYLNS